jgi:hypothetical protein
MLQASRSDDGSVVVQGGFFTDLRTGLALVQCEDGQVRELE